MPIAIPKLMKIKINIGKYSDNKDDTITLINTGQLIHLTKFSRNTI
tara:strand:+ start:676 stop:813 length:138 start_codon:yes stop_codon:yes gene_type:complete